MSLTFDMAIAIRQSFTYQNSDNIEQYTLMHQNFTKLRFMNLSRFPPINPYT